MMLVIISIALVTLSGLTLAEECSGVNGKTFSARDRQFTLELHNNQRSETAKGNMKHMGGTLPAAKNMYKLNWDCELEQMAQTWSETCAFAHSSNDAGENIQYWSTHEDLQTQMKRANKMWWDDEIMAYDASNNRDMIMTNEVMSAGAGHWSQQSWAASTKIGCGASNCSKASGQQLDGTFIVCNFLISGNYYDKPIYEPGAGCSSDAECTTYPNSKCETATQLCSVDGESKPEPEVDTTQKPVVTDGGKPQPGGCEDEFPAQCPTHVDWCHLERISKHCKKTCNKC